MTPLPLVLLRKMVVTVFTSLDTSGWPSKPASQMAAWRSAFASGVQRKELPFHFGNFLILSSTAAQEQRGEKAKGVRLQDGERVCEA